MMCNIETENITHHRLNLLNSRVAEFKNSFTVRANQMVVLLVEIGLLKLREVFTELVFCNQITGKQMFDSIVNSGTADPVLFVFHVDVERFHIKMIIDGINFIEYGKPFRCFPETLFFQKF